MTRLMPEVPDRMKRFPLWKDRYPIFYVVSTNDDGTPNFKVLHRPRQVECIQKNLCMLCGQRNGQPLWWIAHEFEVEHRQVMDNGPMHEECARYATQACPFLVNANYASKTFVDEEGNPARRNRMALCTSAGYRCEPGRQQHPRFFPTEWLSVDWDAMPQPPAGTELAKLMSRTMIVKDGDDVLDDTSVLAEMRKLYDDSRQR